MKNNLKYTKWEHFIPRVYLKGFSNSTLQHLGSLPNLVNQLDQRVHKTARFSRGFGICA